MSTSGSENMEAILSALSEKVDSLASEVASLHHRDTPPPPPPPPPNHPKPHMKLEVPRFNGADALGWIFKITQFFDYHQTPDHERLTIASFYMDGPALSWFQWMMRNGLIHAWPDFLLSLETRFAPSFYDDPRGALFKLQQTGSVNHYLTEFERLANRIVGLPHPFLLSCFISGLIPEIRREVQAFQPMTLPQETALAKIQEDKIADRLRNTRNQKPNFSSTPTQKPSFSPTLTQPPQISPSPSKTQPPTTSNPKVPFRKLTQEEMASRRERNLCYNCDDTFTPQHRCKGRFFMLISEEDIEDLQSEDLSTPPIIVAEETPTPSIPSDAQLSLHAMSGSCPQSTFRICGTIAKTQVVILVDSGSTHNFIQDRVAKFLGLPTTIAPQPLKVMVGDGNLLECLTQCIAVPFSIQGTSFVSDFYILPLGGAEVVLGVPWLVSLGPILTDYTTLKMSFTYLGQQIQLVADAPFKPKDISAPQVKRCIATNSASMFFHLQLIPEPTNQHNSNLSHIQTLISKYQKLFNSPSSLPPHRANDHRIHLQPGTSPVNVRPYRYPYFQKTEIEKQIAELLESGMIRPSRSPFSSPMLLVKKKDGTWRCCVDYRALNAITTKDRFPMPTIDELLDDLGSASWFSKLDLRQGFHQIRMHEDDIPKTAFRTHKGHYEYCVMPFGLCNAPSTFQAEMNEFLRPFLRKFVAVFFDDILVYSSTLAEHLNHLEKVFSKLCEAQFYLKQSKCLLAQCQLEYLGHIITGSGVKVDPSKIAAMVDWPVPNSVTALRGFLGLTGFYRKFICKYASIASPLTKLLRKDGFQWSAEAQSAFEALKSAMTKAPILASPDFSIPFVLETDASGTTMGAVLMQKNHPIAFFSKPFCPRLLRSSTYVRELHVITTTVKKWRQYLLGHKFLIYTDHQSLKQLISQVIQTPEQQVYLSKLLGYDFTIHYKTGKSNVVADALSRIDTTGQCLALSVPTFVFLDDLRKQLSANPEYQTLLTKFTQDPASFPHYKLYQNLLFFKNRIWIVKELPFKDRLLEEFHNSPLSGHMGVDKTLNRLQANFFWEGMRHDVKNFVTNCRVCQTTKYETKKPAGLLQPLPPPTAIWEDLSLDFITGLPNSQGNTAILVVVDRFSKGAHFGALPPNYSAHKVAVIFLDMICKHHGLPRSLISDRDPIFISSFWRELFKLSGTKLRMSTAYHPETDGQTEVLNRSLEQYLRAFVHHKPSLWFNFLPLAEWSYNTSKHSSTGLSPFQVIYGKVPPAIPQYVMGSSPNEVVDSLLSTRQEMIQNLHKRLLKVQKQMKDVADKKRRAVEYKVGDLVYLKLRPYRQQSLSQTSYSKLSKRFYGPYPILAKIGAVAYKLDLPPSSKLHPVFRCSLLKPHHGPAVTDIAELPPSSVANHPLIEPLAILDSKMDTSTTPPTRMVLVQWLGLAPEDTSWENWTDLEVLYHLEDKMNLPGIGIDTNAAIGHTKRMTRRPTYLNDYVSK